MMPEIAEVLLENPLALTTMQEGEKPYVAEKPGPEDFFYGFFKSNEFYKGLRGEIGNSGGIGIAVGPDQGLDLYIMARLDGLNVVDIDSRTNLVTRTYLEAGTRFRKALGRYPTVKEFITLFEPDNFPVTQNLLAAPSTRYSYNEEEIRLLGDGIIESKYLAQKAKFYGEDSWIGNNSNLEKVLRAYEEGKIKIYRGSVFGKLTRRFGREMKAKGQHVSLVYVSNVKIIDGDALRSLFTLPITKTTRVIFSSANEPEGYRSTFRTLRRFPYSAHRWSYFVFHPHQVTEWPKPHAYNRRDFKEFSRGCYKLVLE